MVFRRGIRVTPYCLYEIMKRRKAIKGKARRAWAHLTSSIVRMPLYRCLCLCNLISYWFQFAPHTMNVNDNHYYQDVIYAIHLWRYIYISPKPCAYWSFLIVHYLMLISHYAQSSIHVVYPPHSLFNKSLNYYSSCQNATVIGY